MVFGIVFAPLNVPLHRRIQTLATVFAVSTFFLGHVLPWLFIVVGLVCLPGCAPLLITYLFWIYVWDRDTPSRGGRHFTIIRKLPIWNYFRDYFPVQLVRTVALPPDNNYVFCCHPHGVISVGHFTAFGTEAVGFSSLFPGITPHLLTLDMNFRAPLLRDFLMAHGICACNKESCLNCLQLGRGHSIAIIIGGAAESLEARPESTTVVLKRRKGFIKLALQTGASLVPVFAFGENDLFKQVSNPPGSLLRRVQTRFKDTMGFAPPIFYGRGIFNYSMGLLPHRHPVYVVVGKPLAVEKVENPNSDLVDEIHEQYTKSLRELFESHKTQYGLDDSAQLVIV